MHVKQVTVLAIDAAVLVIISVTDHFIGYLIVDLERRVIVDYLPHPLDIRKFIVIRIIRRIDESVARYIDSIFQRVLKEKRGAFDPCLNS